MLSAEVRVSPRARNIEENCDRSSCSSDILSACVCKCGFQTVWFYVFLFTFVTGLDLSVNITIRNGTGTAAVMEFRGSTHSFILVTS